MGRTYFDKELETLHTDLIKMGGMIEEAIEKSITALQNGDTNLAQEVIENDKHVDDIEKVIESRCLHLLLRQQPVAKDLRAISTAIKMITDMERIGDQAADIADISKRFIASNSMTVSNHIPKMAEKASLMVSESINAFINSDLELARKTMQKDDEVDDLFDIVKKDIIDILKTECGRADEAIDTMMIAKYIERIGDHAVNICEWVEFYETGVHKSTQII